MNPRSLGWLGQAVIGLALWTAVHPVGKAGEAPGAVWPKEIAAPQGRCTVFEPQVTRLEGDRLSARAALAVAAADSTNVTFGIAQLEARAVAEGDGRQTTVSGIGVLETRFAPANASAMAGLREVLGPELSQVTWTVSSQALQEDLAATGLERKAAAELRTTPPQILYSSKPAALVQLDGPPQLRALTNSALLRVVNTPYAMVYEPAGKRYWLQGSYEWFSATDWRGEWTAVAQAPAEVMSAVPRSSATNAPPLGSLTSVSPSIVVATEPSELVVTRGEPVYAPVAGTDLLYVSNSDQLLFFTIDSKEFYVAFSGRWYRSPALTGPWNVVASDQLPPAFARMTPGSPKSEALTYVAGTVEAEGAVLQANIPQITAVERGPATVEVQYDGAPKFQPVETTGVQYATNTAEAVFLVGGQYYLCRDAVWYAGASPEGPWSVATSVPVEIQALPPSNPHYNVKYVYVYGSTPETVYVGYVPGYAGCYVYGPTVVYGTGWWYPGYYGPGYCWSYPATFGFGFGYNSWYGWSVGVGFGYGWLSCGYGWGWGGCYPWGWWGPCGSYWACAPYYPCYGGYYRYRDGHHGDGGHYGGGGQRPSSQPVPPRNSMRSELRKDAPAPGDRPTNPQRRTLPEYARTAKAPSQPTTALRSGRGIESGSAMAGAPGRPMPPTRAEGTGGGARPVAGGNSIGTGASAAVPSRVSSGTPSTAVPGSRARAESASVGRAPTAPSGQTTAAPSRSAFTAAGGPAGGQPGRSAAGAAAAPTRGTGTGVPGAAAAPAGSWPGARPGTAASQPAAPRVGSAPAGSAPVRWAPPGGAPVYARAPVSSSVPTRSWPGAGPSVGAVGGRAPSSAPGPGYGGVPSRSVAPYYGARGMSGAPAMRGPSSSPAPPMRSSPGPSYSAPMRSAPMPSAPMRSAPSYSGGSMGRGGAPSRGR